MIRPKQSAQKYRLLLSIILLIVVVIGCTQFGASESSVDGADNSRLANDDSPRPDQQASLPVPSTPVEEARIFAPVLMDSSTTQAQTANIAALLSQTVTTTANLATPSDLEIDAPSPDLVPPQPNSVQEEPEQPEHGQPEHGQPEHGQPEPTQVAVANGEGGNETPVQDQQSTPLPETTSISVTNTGLLSTTPPSTASVAETVLPATILTTTVIISGSESNQDQTATDQLDVNSDGNSSQEEGVSEVIRVERTVNVPILMYHYLSIPPADADIYRLDLSVTPDQFSRHLDAMLDAGYTTISLFDLWNHLENGASLPPKPVVLTFDDGYLDNYENAFPLLIQRGMTATFFIVTGFIEEGRDRYVNWQMVEEMYDAGMSIESHSTRHFSLKNRDAEFLIFEALRTKEIIEAKIGSAPRFVSYPAGEYDQTTIDVFRSANYLMGVTTIQGGTHSNDNLFELRRVRIRGTTGEVQLLELLELDW